MLNICLTYDYELFLGRNNASFDDILFSPTQKLSEVMVANGVRGTFFADVCSALANKPFPDNGYYEGFTRQIQNLVTAGHDVQLHLHTNWYNAKAQNGQLELTSEGYRIHDFGFDENKEICVQKIVTETKAYLEKTLRQVKPDYRCIAFRAGGFGVQPENQLFRVFLDNGIRLDSSVLPNMKAAGVNHFDFTNIPHLLNWYVNPEAGFSHNSVNKQDALYEVPVLTLRPRLLEYIGKPKSQLSLPPVFPKGEYVKGQANVPNGFFLRNINRFFAYRYISLDSRYYQRIVDDLKYVYRKYHLDRQDAYISLICHPKLVDQARIDNIGFLIAEINKEPEKFRFVTFNDIAPEFGKDQVQ